MIEYSHNNSLSFGFDGHQFNSRPTAESSLRFQMQRCTRQPGSFKEECYAVAKLMSRKARLLGRKPFVLLSGGMDSEVVVRSYLDQGFQFTPITFRFERGLNDHEIYYVERFCKRHDLTPTYFDIDVVRTLNTSAAKGLWDKSFCSSPIMLCHMVLMSHIWKNLKGMPILGGGDVVVEKHDDLTWHYSKFEYILAWYWHMRSNSIDGGTAFFQHTPEITLAMLREPEIENVAMGRDADANKLLKDCRVIKYGVYQKHWPDLELRPKFGGGEKVGFLAQTLRKVWSSQQTMEYGATWSEPYAQFRASIEPEK